MNATAAKQAIDLATDWSETSRWTGISRDYTAEDVIRLQGSVGIEQTLARRGAEKLWRLLHEEDYIAALGAITGGQAVQMVKAGLKAIYLSGWQVAADGNLVGQVYPDQSLYPANSVPAMVRRLNNALLRADQIDWAEGNDRDRLARADRRRRGGGLRRPAERLRADEGDDRGRRGGGPLRGPARRGEEVRPPRRQGARADEQFIRTLLAARLAADVLGVPTLVVARTDADAADTADERRRRARRRVPHRRADARGVLPRPGRHRSGDRARARLRAVRGHRLDGDVDARPRRGARVRGGDPRRVPGQAARVQLLALVQLEAPPRRRRRSPRSSASSARMGYRFQFITLAGFHALNESMFELARGYSAEGMTAYVAPAGARVRARGRRLHGDPPPARGRRRLLRRGRAGGLRRAQLDARADGIDGRGAVRAERRRALTVLAVSRGQTRDTAAAITSDAALQRPDCRHVRPRLGEEAVLAHRLRALVVRGEGEPLVAAELAQ